MRKAVLSGEHLTSDPGRDAPFINGNSHSLPAMFKLCAAVQQPQRLWISPVGCSAQRGKGGAMGGQPIAGDTSGAEHPAGLILPTTHSVVSRQGEQHVRVPGAVQPQRFVLNLVTVAHVHAGRMHAEQLPANGGRCQLMAVSAPPNNR